MTAAKKKEYEPDGRDVQLADEVARAEVDLKLAKANAAAYKAQREADEARQEEEAKIASTTVA